MDKIDTAVISVIDPSFEAFMDQIKETGEFDEQEFLDEMNGVRLVLDDSEARLFDWMLKDRLDILRLFCSSGKLGKPSALISNQLPKKKEELAKIIPINSSQIKLRNVLRKCFPDLLEKQQQWEKGAENRREKFIQRMVSEIDKQLLDLLIKLPGRKIYKTGVSLSLNPNEDFAVEGGRNYQLCESPKLDAWLAKKGFFEAEKRLQQKYPDFQINISLIRIDTDKMDFTHVQIGFDINLEQQTDSCCQVYHFGEKK